MISDTLKKWKRFTQKSRKTSTKKRKTYPTQPYRLSKEIWYLEPEVKITTTGRSSYFKFTLSIMHISCSFESVAIESAEPGQETQPATLYLDLTGCKGSYWTDHLHSHLAENERVSREDSHRIWGAH